MIKLATVSPCYNEEEVLRHSIERLTALFERMIDEGLISDDSMMVFVNDGSRDHTWDIIRELHEKNRFVRGINLARNVGHQNAIMAGMMTAKEWADAVVTLYLAGGWLYPYLLRYHRYLGKIYTEVKRRPLYHIQEILE
jgi:glycosyltransferase involved in cell wall biosynthesis